MNYKKGLCFLLVLSLVLGSFPAGVLAEDTGLQQAAHTENEVVTAGDEAQAEMPKDALPMDEADGTALPDRQLETAAPETTPAADFTYQEEADGSVTITGYTGSAEEVVFPEEIEGKPVKTIGGLRDNTTLKSIIVPEGVETIGYSAFYNCTNLSNIDLPSTITKLVNGNEIIDGSWSEVGPFSGCALTNLDGFCKIKMLKGDLNLNGNQLTDVNGIKDIAFKEDGSSPIIINLRDNPELTDITSLKGIEAKSDTSIELNVQDTKVSDRMAYEVSDIHYDDVETNEIYGSITVKPTGMNVIYGPYQSYGFDNWTIPVPLGRYDKISVLSENEAIVNCKDPGYGGMNCTLDIHQPGTTKVTIRIKLEDGYMDYPFTVTVKAMETEESGKPVANLPTLNIEEHFTTDGVYQLNLQDDGTLYNVTGGESQPIMENVKDITTSQRTIREESGIEGEAYPDLLFIQDNDDGFWIQPDMAQNPVKISDNVQKYVGNNAYNIIKTDGAYGSATFINYQNDAWAYILHKDGSVDWMDNTGDVERQNIQNVKDIANLADTSYDDEWYDIKTGAGWSIAGMLALNNNNELWYRVGLPGTDYVKLAENVASIEPNMYFIDTSGQKHKITAEITKDNVLSVTEAVDNALARWPDFYVTAEGSWYQPEGQDAVKICDTQMIEKPARVYENSERTYYFRDNYNTFWCYNTAKDKAEKIDENVVKFVQGTRLGSSRIVYLREDHVMVDMTTGEKTEGVKDISGNSYEMMVVSKGSGDGLENTFEGPYILYEDGRLVYSGAEVMDGVEKIETTSNVATWFYSNIDTANAYILRSDGTIWVHDLNNPTVVTKLADYTPVVSLGDIDGDGEINASDALLALRHSVREIDLKNNPPTEFPAGAFERANVTFDTEVNASDALQILRYSVKEITEFKRPEAAEA